MTFGESERSLRFSEGEVVGQLRQRFLEAFPEYLSDGITETNVRFQQYDDNTKEYVGIKNEEKLENNARVRAVICEVPLVFMYPLCTHLVSCRARLPGLIFEDIIKIDMRMFLGRMRTEKSDVSCCNYKGKTVLEFSQKSLHIWKFHRTTRHARCCQKVHIACGTSEAMV